MNFESFFILLMASCCLSCPPNNSGHRIYDIKTKRFNESYGGINENYLNLIGKELINDEISFLQQVDERERELDFISTDEGKERYTALTSKFETIFTAEENFLLIKEIDNKSIEEIEEYYLPLKRLLNELNMIYEQEMTISEKFELMYEKISEKMRIGEGNSSSINIEHLLNGERGDCNDLTPAYFVLLNYYGISTYMRIGKILEKDKELGIHTWLTIETEKGWIDVDPVGYSCLVPLDDRNEELELVLLKEESMFYKGKPPERNIIHAE